MTEFKGSKDKWEYKINYGRKRTNITVQIPTRSGYKKELTLGFIGEDDCDVASCCNIEDHANALLISNSLNLLNNAQMHIDALDLSQVDFYNKYGFNVSELIPKTRELIKQSTEL